MCDVSFVSQRLVPNKHEKQKYFCSFALFFTDCIVVHSKLSKPRREECDCPRHSPP